MCLISPVKTQDPPVRTQNPPVKRPDQPVETQPSPVKRRISRVKSSTSRAQRFGPEGTLRPWPSKLIADARRRLRVRAVLPPAGRLTIISNKRRLQLHGYQQLPCEDLRPLQEKGLGPKHSAATGLWQIKGKYKGRRLTATIVEVLWLNANRCLEERLPSF